MATRVKACGCWRAPRSARAVAHRSRWSPPLTRPRSATGGMGAAPGWWASWCAELVHASRSRPRGGALQPSPTVEASQRHARRIAGAHVKTSKTLVSQFYHLYVWLTLLLPLCDRTEISSLNSVSAVRYLIAHSLTHERAAKSSRDVAVRPFVLLLNKCLRARRFQSSKLISWFRRGRLYDR